MKNDHAPAEDRNHCGRAKGTWSTNAGINRSSLEQMPNGKKNPRYMENARVILVQEKSLSQIGQLLSYKPVSHPYKLLTKVIPNRLTKKLEDYQPSDQAGFRKRYSTIHIKPVRTLIEKSTEYNVPLRLAFVDYNKSVDSIELWAGPVAI